MCIIILLLFLYIYVYIYIFTNAKMFYMCFFNEVSSAHQDCLFDQKYCKNMMWIIIIKMAVFYVNIC